MEELRIASDWTQAELAAEAGVSRDTISKLESGARKSAHGPTVAKLAQALRVGPQELCAAPSPTDAGEGTGRWRYGGNPLAEHYRAMGGHLPRGTALGDLLEATATLPDEYVNALVVNARALEAEERYYTAEDPDRAGLGEGSFRVLEGEERKHALLRNVCRALGEYELDLLIRIAGHLMAARLAMARAEGYVREDAEAEDRCREEARAREGGRS